MRFAVLLSLAALLGAASALLVACGSSDDDLVPERDAAALKRYADRVGQAVAAEDCQRASDDIRRAQARVSKLPSKVDPDLRANIEDGFNNLAQQAERDCQGTTETTPTETQPTETTPTETTPTETQPTETTDTTPTETQPPSTETEPPPDGGGTTAPGDQGGGKGKAEGAKKVKGQ